MPSYLFLCASAREAGAMGNSEQLARAAAKSLSPEQQTWLRLADYPLAPFFDVRHTVGSYAHPEGAEKILLDATLQHDHLVLVAPVYWFSFPTHLKNYLDHYSGWLRVPDLPFKETMAGKTLSVISCSGNRAKAEPMFTSAKLCADFLSMRFHGALWGQGGAPGAVASDSAAMAAATNFFMP